MVRIESSVGYIGEMTIRCFTTGLLLLLTLSIGTSAAADADFEKSVWPILQEHCVACHGPDDQQGRLRLDAKAIVQHGGVSGPSIVAGKAADSLLLKRILGEGDQDRMPLEADPLTRKQTDLIRRWIDEGAHWPDGLGSDAQPARRHWAYVTPARPRLPRQQGVAANDNWPNNPIDLFIGKRLSDENLQPSPQQDRLRLFRRLTLDLTGLPPTLDELQQFTSDDRPDALDCATDRLLASPRYGERWAVPWLDAARYADSNGYQRDGRRNAWAWRDWVIRSLNADKPFDEFTVEQIAGDLLPSATIDQQIATGFHRGTMANVEAGTDPEEERFLAITDRVNTTATVWLGSTIECAQCHNHKYDPFTQREYYQLYAFFNSTEKEIDKNGSGRTFTGPKIELPLDAVSETKRTKLGAEIDVVKEELESVEKQLRKLAPDWEQRLAGSTNGGWNVLKPVSYESKEGAALKRLPDESLLANGNVPGTDIYEVIAETAQTSISAIRLEIMTDKSLPKGGPGRVEPGNFILSEFKVEAAAAESPNDFRPVTIASVSADYSQPNWHVKNSIDGNRKTGWAVARQFGKGHHAVFVLKKTVGFASGTRLRLTLDQQYGKARTIGRFQLLATEGDPATLAIPTAVTTALKQPAKKRTKAHKKSLAEYQRSLSPEWTEVDSRRKELEDQLGELKPSTSLVMQELESPRETKMFKRGDFLQPGEPVKPDVPGSLHAWNNNWPRNRLGLANWLVDSANPLVARVTMNRHWAEFFGHGIVETLEDFGTQGDRPTHADLLDWMAVTFAENGWSLKQMHRNIVNSATYRQSARLSDQLADLDRYNRLYARGPRQRLKAEFIRDNALAIAGQLSNRLHGPPVFPYQPKGVWNHIGVASNDWKTSSGDDLYRRGVYVYWRRTCYYPSFANFDAPTREACSVQRSLSNTPLQALTLMNDPVYFEAAGLLAERVIRLTGSDASPSDRVRLLFQLATGREPVTRELAILENRFTGEFEKYSDDAKLSETILKSVTPQDVNETKHQNADRPVSDAEFAAWIHVASVVLNLDETITK